MLDNVWDRESQGNWLYGCFTLLREASSAQPSPPTLTSFVLSAENLGHRPWHAAPIVELMLSNNTTSHCAVAVADIISLEPLTKVSCRSDAKISLYRI